jgi:hypothetical protein
LCKSVVITFGYRTPLIVSCSTFNPGHWIRSALLEERESLVFLHAEKNQSSQLSTVDDATFANDEDDVDEDVDDNEEVDDDDNEAEVVDNNEEVDDDDNEDVNEEVDDDDNEDDEEEVEDEDEEDVNEGDDEEEDEEVDDEIDEDDDDEEDVDEEVDNEESVDEEVDDEDDDEDDDGNDDKSGRASDVFCTIIYFVKICDNCRDVHMSPTRTLMRFLLPASCL